jgi:copper homeostasis protein
MTATKSRVLLEIAIAGVDDAVAAERGGADRLELNAALALGGLTPSLGTLVEVKAASRLPVLCMIRPRPGGFAYSAADFRVMLRDLALTVEHGADGIVCGILQEDGTIDMPRSSQLMRAAQPCPVVFHRAFDVTPDPFAALEQLIDLGIRRVMTSGQEESASLGVPLIADLVRRAAGRIEVLPASGIRRSNVADLVARTGCDQVHASLRCRRMDRSTSARPQVNFGGAPGTAEDCFEATSTDLVAEVHELLGRLA